ncbi:unnamed protein product, partial [Discosporangium mesarthrocarpum]
AHSSTHPTATCWPGICGVSSGIDKSCGAGFCCSQYDFCGNTEEHCGDGCQPTFGSCLGNGEQIVDRQDEGCEISCSACGQGVELCNRSRED